MTVGVDEYVVGLYASAVGYDVVVAADADCLVIAVAGADADDNVAPCGLDWVVAVVLVEAYVGA